MGYERSSVCDKLTWLNPTESGSEDFKSHLIDCSFVENLHRKIMPVLLYNQEFNQCKSKW